MRDNNGDHWKLALNPSELGKALREAHDNAVANLQSTLDLLADDLVIYGACYVIRRADGTVVRKHPSDVTIKFRSDSHE